MELSDFVGKLRRELASITRFAGEDVARAAELLTEVLDSSVRLVLLDVLSAAAAEITARLDDTVVEVRLANGEPAFVVTTTVRVCPLARLPNGQFSTLALIVQTPPGLPVGVNVHALRLPSVGSGSLRTTLFAVPGPVAVTTIVKLMLSPMLYVAFFGFFVSV